MRFTVYVVDEEERPLEGRRVHLSFTSLLRGWLDESTDDDGHAVFDDVEAGEATITVSGETHGPYWVDDGDSFTIQV